MPAARGLQWPSSLCLPAGNNSYLKNNNKKKNQEKKPPPSPFAFWFLGSQVARWWMSLPHAGQSDRKGSTTPSHPHAGRGALPGRDSLREGLLELHWDLAGALGPFPALDLSFPICTMGMCNFQAQYCGKPGSRVEGFQSWIGTMY